MPKMPTSTAGPTFLPSISRFFLNGPLVVPAPDGHPEPLLLTYEGRVAYARVRRYVQCFCAMVQGWTLVTVYRGLQL
jgi:hypothetical protein